MGNGKKEKKSMGVMIDPNIMWELKQFYNQDDCIQKCRTAKITELERHQSSIQWWFKNEIQLSQPDRFNTEQYQRELHRVLWQAQDYIELFRFVGFYIVKDIGKWESKEKSLLPFGVLEFGLHRETFPGYFTILRKKSSFDQEIVFYCTDETKRRNYNFFVFDRGAQFKTPLRMDTNSSQSPVQNFLQGNSQNQAIIGMIPISRFESLVDKSMRIVEVAISLYDAHSMACRPESFLVAKPLEKIDIEHVDQDVQYAMNDIDSGKQEIALDRLNVGLDYAAAQKERLRQNVTGGYYNNNSNWKRRNLTTYQQRSILFGRPTMCESFEYLPASVGIDRGPTPRSLIDPSVLQNEYEKSVCNIMCYPYSLFKAHSNGPMHHGNGDKSGKSGGSGGGAINNSQLQMIQKQLDDVIVGQEKIFQQLFQELYMRSYAHLNIYQLQQQQDTEKFKILLEGMTIKLVYDNQLSKTDLAIQNLLPFYHADVITKEEIRSLLVRNFGFEPNEESFSSSSSSSSSSEEEEEGSEEIMKKRYRGKEKEKEKKNVKKIKYSHNK